MTFNKLARSVVGLLALSLFAGQAGAQSPFASFGGTWSGSGQVRLTGGQTESIKCRAYYTQKSASDVNLALRCASASHKIDMRASLTAQGNAVSGAWEERSFNASGTVAGKATDGRITLSITGGGFTGSMSVTTSGANQDINLKTEGIGFTGISMSLSKG